jgi:lipopolysaccharide export system protein LptA
VVQTGNVLIQEAQRTATADRATFNQASDTMALTGSVHYTDSAQGATLTSNTLTLNRSTGETIATGNVKTTYAAMPKAQPSSQPSSGALLPSSQAVHVTAAQMVEKNQTGTAQYSGAARLWQGGNIIQAPVIELNRKENTLDAQSGGGARVSTVFVQTERSGKQSPVEVIADHLHYVDSQRKAFFSGSVLGRSTESTLRAQEAVVTLRPQEPKPAKPKPSPTNAPSEVQTIDATGNILLQQPGRRAVGSHLFYTADDEKFVLKGTPGAPPSIFDAEHGQVTGVSLTFFNRDDRVLVDSSNSTSITQNRLKK